MTTSRLIKMLMLALLVFIIMLWFYQAHYYTVNNKKSLNKNLKINIDRMYDELLKNEKENSKKFNLFESVKANFINKNVDSHGKKESFMINDPMEKPFIKVPSTVKHLEKIKDNSILGINSDNLGKKESFVINDPTEKPFIKVPSTVKQLEKIKDNSILGINSVEEAEDIYFNTITKNTINCTTSKRFGRYDDGGWDVCIVDKLKIKFGDCVVYSFGVNFIWEFDDELSSKHNCIVRTFDPSMSSEPVEYQRKSKVWFYKIGLGKEDTIWPNGWKIMKFSSILKKFNEENAIIDILKIDIEYSEWDSFSSMIDEGRFQSVKQLLFETHTEEVQGRATSKQNYLRFLKIWNSLYLLGFRQWKNHWNHFGNFQSRTGAQRTCCYEHYLINTNFL